MNISMVLPTYNERENIEVVLTQIFEVFKQHEIQGKVIVVDDNSGDGTAEIVRGLTAAYPIDLIRRERKAGIGSAYVAGFKHALDSDADVIFEMDADLSHNPWDIPRFIKNIADYDVVVGSRYVEGGGIEHWGLHRRVVSRTANMFSRKCLSLKINDLTSGFRAYRGEVLEVIDLNEIESDGYAFQVEMLHRASKKGFKIKEIPIVFKERREGKSKLSNWDVFDFFGFNFNVLKNRLFKKHLV